MKNRFNTLELQHKYLVVGFSTIVLMLIVTSLISVYYSLQTNRKLSLLVVLSQQKHDYLAEMREGIRKRQINFREIILNRDDVFSQDVLWREADSYASDVLLAKNRFEETGLSKTEAQLFSRIIKVMKTAYDRQNNLAERILYDNTLGDINSELKSILKIQEQVFAYMDEMGEFLHTTSNRKLSDIEKQAQQNKLFLTSFSLLVIIVAGAMALLIIRKHHHQDMMIQQYIADINELNISLEKRVHERTNELLLAKEHAERSSQAKAEFLSNMSHELRTPLNAIYGSAQILEQLTRDFNETDREWVSNILGSSLHLRNLINDVLDISKINAGKLRVKPEPLDVRECINQSLDAITPMIKDKKIHLVKELNCDAMGMADPLRLKQILINLLSNAVKYNDIGGEVSIGCEIYKAKYIRITVRDSGEGISEEDLPRIFDMFERLGKEGSTELGSGVGLALCMKLVELMDGDIGVQSVKDEGSLFWVNIPIAS